jgi:hypothetical protein
MLLPVGLGHEHAPCMRLYNLSYIHTLPLHNFVKRNLKATVTASGTRAIRIHGRYRWPDRSLLCADCQMTSSNVLLIEFAIAVSQSPTASSSLSDRNAPLRSNSSVAASTIPGDVPVSDPSQDSSVGSTDGFARGLECRPAWNLLVEFCFLYRAIQRSSVCRMDITDDRNLILRVKISSSGKSYWAKALRTFLSLSTERRGWYPVATFP